MSGPSSAKNTLKPPLARSQAMVPPPPLLPTTAKSATSISALRSVGPLGVWVLLDHPVFECTHETLDVIASERVSHSAVLAELLKKRHTPGVGRRVPHIEQPMQHVPTELLHQSRGFELLPDRPMRRAVV